MRGVARDADLVRRTILKLARGESWGGVPTIARLERALGTRLWGDEHLRPPPRSYTNSGEWPNGKLSREAPAEADLLQALVLRLQGACGRRSLSDVAHKAKVSVHTIRDLINGTSWGDLTTIARLERFLGTRLWGEEHRWARRPRQYLYTGDWPEGRLIESAPPEARLAQVLALRLHIACSRSSPEAVALAARINPRVVQDLLAGTVWADFAVIARLEEATETALWGDEHFQPVRQRTIKETQRQGQRRRY